MTTAFDDLLSAITDKALNRDCLGRAEPLAVLASSDDELLDVIAADSRVRRKFFGRRVKLNYLVNMKSGCGRKTATTNAPLCCRLGKGVVFGGLTHRCVEF
jgi:hypothetical protein